MKIPKYIMEKLKMRCEYARIVNVLDCQIHDWMKSKDIEIDCHDYDNEFLLLNSILLITEPIILRDKTIEYIENRGENK